MCSKANLSTCFLFAEAMSGILTPLFSSGPTMGPYKPWHIPMSYPAIGGLTRIKGTTFAHFIEKCGRKHVAIMTNKKYGDIIHPMEMEHSKFDNVAEANKLYVHAPDTSFINPSDCVDMDCDALRKMCISDKDGTMFGKIGGTVISKSEYQWDGDRAFGLG